MAQIINTDGNTLDIELKSLEQMQEVVGGKIDFIQKDDFIMIVNQMPKKMSINKKASEILSKNVYGNTIICKKNEIY
jgi:hypothetical protein